MHVTQAIEKLRAVSDAMSDWTLSPSAKVVLAEIEAVIALLEDPPPETVVKTKPADRTFRSLAEVLDCTFPRCGCKSDQRC